jgi:hypothetical protein
MHVINVIVLYLKPLQFWLLSMIQQCFYYVEEMDRPKPDVAGNSSMGNVIKRGDGRRRIVAMVLRKEATFLHKRNNVMEINIHVRSSQTSYAFINCICMVNCSIVSVAMMVGLITKGRGW